MHTPWFVYDTRKPSASIGHSFALLVSYTSGMRPHYLWLLLALHARSSKSVKIVGDTSNSTRMHAPLRKCTVYWWVNRWLTLPIRSNTPMRNQSLPKPLRIQSRTNSRKPFGHSWPKMGMRHVALTPPSEPTLSRIPSWMFWFSSCLMISANILSSYLVNRLRKTSACQTCSSLLMELVRLKLHKMCTNEGQDVTSDWHQSPPLNPHHSDWFLPILLQNQCLCV